MLYYALMFLLVALIAGALGFGVVAFAAAEIARIVFFVFIVLFLVGLISHTCSGERATPKSIPWLSRTARISRSQAASFSESLPWEWSTCFCTFSAICREGSRGSNRRQIAIFLDKLS